MSESFIDNDQSVSYRINSTLQGDPATRLFGLFLLASLTIFTLGVIVGIAAGNISHYKYFTPYDGRNISSVLLPNISSLRAQVSEKPARRLWSPVNERVESARKTRSHWSMFDQPDKKRRW